MYTGRGKYGKNWMRQAAGTVGGLLKRKKFGSDLYDVTAGAALKEMEFANSMTPAGMAGIVGSGLYTGTGEYMGPETNGLIASSKSTMDVVPLFAHDSDQGVVITKREYVSEIYGPALTSPSTAEPFSLQSFAINPGLERTFPWLSQIAANYDEYTMNQLIFTFKSTTTESGNQTNGQVGTVIMATNYNAAAAPFAEKFTMMQYDKANSSRLTESLQHGVECNPALLSGSHGEYVRVNPVVSNQDLKTYDHGLFQIAVANCTANLSNQSLGELWVSYSVTLRKPKFFTGKGLAISKDIFLSFPSGSETNANPLGSNTLKGQQNNIGILAAPTATINVLSLTFPAYFAGFLKVMVAADYIACANPILDPFAVVSGNIQFVADLYGPGTTTGDSPQGQMYTRTQLVGATVSPTIGWIAICHISIQIATNGVNNVVSITLPYENVGATREQLSIECCEYNSGFSYKANNISSSEAPIWVNKSGIIVVP